MADDKINVSAETKPELAIESLTSTGAGESQPGGSGDAAEVKPSRSALNVQRDKSPAGTRRDQAPGAAKRDKSPVPSTTTKPGGQGTGSLALKAATQTSRLLMLKSIHERVTSGRASDFTLSELADLRGQSNDIWAKFSAVHDVMTESCSEDFLSHPYVVENTYSRACAVHCALNSRLARYRDELTPPHSESSGTTSTAGAAATDGRAHLPKIALPTFSGEYSQWISFRDLFTSLVINNRGINDVDRMHYLRASTTGEAAKLIGSLAIEADSFSTAWGTITERYQNDRVLVTSHLESLFKTTVIKPRSAQDLHALLHNITEACNALRVLGAPTEHWDWVLVYAIARRLDPGTREAWELKAGQSREPPTFSQLRAFLTNRARALEGAEVGVISGSSSSGSRITGTESRAPPKESSRVLAATSGDSAQCAYCREAHYVAACGRFRQLSPEARRAEVQKLRLCFNCLGRHSVAACNTTARCKECDRKHHTLIHVGWSKYGDGSRPPSNSASTGGAASSASSATGSATGSTSTGTTQ